MPKHDPPSVDPYAPPKVQIHLSTILVLTLLAGGYGFLWTIPTQFGPPRLNYLAYGWPMTAVRVVDGSASYRITEAIVDGLMVASILYLIAFVMEPSMRKSALGQLLAIFSGCTLALSVCMTVINFAVR